MLGWNSWWKWVQAMTLGGSGLVQKEDKVAARRPTLSQDRVPCSR
jgi:hypothetical protein